jgi:hypothetical protein
MWWKERKNVAREQPYVNHVLRFWKEGTRAIYTDDSFSHNLFFSSSSSPLSFFLAI